MLGDRLAAGRRVLAPLTEVRILVPQPGHDKPLLTVMAAFSSKNSPKMMNSLTPKSGTSTCAGIYVHFPFCLSRCNYCSFVSFPYLGPLSDDYFRLLESEIGMWAGLYGKQGLQHKDMVFDSIYVGGGTPSIAPPDYWERTLKMITSVFNILPGAEITIEANPATFDRSKAISWRRSGFNRVSLGGQSFDDGELNSMGRIYRRAAIQDGVQVLKETGLSNISMDLLVGYPGQTMNSVEKSIQETVACDPCHISAYLLEIKNTSVIEGLMTSGRMQPMDEDLAADIYEMVCSELAEYGYMQYEISNFCKPGKESAHNMKYWTDGFFLGIGTGAHGRLEKMRYANHSVLDQYKTDVVAGKFPWDNTVELDLHTRMVEALLMGLRLNQGLDLMAMSEKYGMNVRDFVLRRLEDLAEIGLFVFRGDVMSLTDRGRLLSNIVFERFI